MDDNTYGVLCMALVILFMGFVVYRATKND